jgi:PleD family two-component response regulator
VEQAGKPLSVTLSAGIASLACAGGMTTKAALVSLADQRLYSAKQGGRNRVVGG